DTRRKPVTRDSAVPRPTTALERTSLWAPPPSLGSVTSRRDGRGPDGAAPAAAPVGDPPDGEEQPGADREEDADAADDGGPHRVAGRAEGQAAVLGGHLDVQRERPGRPRLHGEADRVVARLQRDDLLRAVREDELVAVELDAHADQLTGLVVEAE